MQINTCMSCFLPGKICNLKSSIILLGFLIFIQVIKSKNKDCKQLRQVFKYMNSSKNFIRVSNSLDPDLA